VREKNYFVWVEHKKLGRCWQIFVRNKNILDGNNTIDERNKKNEIMLMAIN
jgi:hypothetical protein